VKRPEGFDSAPAPQTSRQAAQQPAKTTAGARPVVHHPASVAPKRARRLPAPSPRVDRAARKEARRFTRGSRRRRATGIALLSIVIVLLGVLAVAVFSPILALRSVDVEGAGTIPISTVRGAVANQLGTPLALLNDGEIRSRLSRITLIRSYVTEVVPPNTLVVRIVERQAVGVLQDGAGFAQVDPAGVVLRHSSTSDGLPIIDIGGAGVGSAGFAAAVKVLLAMPASVFGEVKSISATTLDNVTLTLRHGDHTVVWGSSSQSDLKARALTTLLKTCAAQPVLNVTAPLALACGPNQPTPTATPTPTSTP
jgi:cell division protein FtsQ